MLHVNHVSFSIDNKEILKDIELKFEKSVIHSILGRNGTGKSTLASLIMGIRGYRPTTGKIFLNNEDISELSVYERAKKGITLAWQSPARIEGITVGEYLQLSYKDKSRYHPAECLSMVGLSPSLYFGRMLDSTLSGGERKRIELASVLAMSPDFIILDEPDSGIDHLSLNDIANVIRTIKENGSGVILITHRDKISAIAEKASIICNGTILQTGTPEKISRYFREKCESCTHINDPEKNKKESENGN